MTHHEIDTASRGAWNMRHLDLQEAYREAVTLLHVCESEGYRKGIAESCKTLGYCYWRFSDFSLSLSHSLRALKLFHELGDKRGEADTLNNIGAVHMFQKDHHKRLEVNIMCKSIREEINDLEGVSSSEGNIGETYIELGELDKAEKCLENVLMDKNSSVQSLAWAHFNLGRIFQLKDQFEHAEKKYELALKLSQSENYNVLVTEAQIALTVLFLAEQDYNKAMIAAEAALDVARSIGAKEDEKRALYYLSLIYEKKGQFEDSLKYHKDFHNKEVEINRDTEIERLKTTQLRAAYDTIEEQRNELVDSIRYAEHIQNAVLSLSEEQDALTDYFVVYQPKDIVSGDFYWYHEKGRYFYMCVADCTGHGVPGAFLTMLGTTFLNEIVALNIDATPAFILERLRYRLIKALKQSERIDSNRDGMDISLIRFDMLDKSAQWAGAYNPIWVTRSADNEHLETDAKINTTTDGTKILYEIKGDKTPVGYRADMEDFTNHEFQLLIGDTIYLMSDGFADQFGGPEDKKFSNHRLKETILNLEDVDINDRGFELYKILNQWKGKRDQIDDVCMIGLKIIEVRPEDLRDYTPDTSTT